MNISVKDKTNLTKYILWLPIVSVIISVISILIVIYITIENNYKLQKEMIINDFINNLKTTTKQRIEVAYNILDWLYKSNLDKKNPKEATLKMIPEIFDKVKWGKKGYIFIMDFKGNTIYHPNHSLIGKNRWNLKRNGQMIVQTITKAVLKHPEGAFVEYWAYNPLGKRPIKKISYVKEYKPLHIYLGTGVYLDYLDKKLLQKQEENRQLYINLFKKILIISLIILTIIIIITFYISNKIKNLFVNYTDYLQREKRKLFIKANYDSLTGLFSKSYFLNLIEEDIKKIKNNSTKKGALFFIDLDRFKEINDSYGHDYGDKILQKVANRIKKHVRNNDLVSRFGGDEFVVYLKDVDKDIIKDVASRILNEIKKPIENKNGIINYVSGSIGIAIVPDDSINLNTLIKYADIAMYRAKEEGKDRFVFFNTKMEEEVKKITKLKSDLIRAIENDELEPFFQPQFDKNDKLYGAEALVRWRKNNKFIPPFEFIPAAINLGIIDKIDLFIIEKTIKQYIKWKNEGLNPGVISCNVTMYQLENTDFAKDLKNILDKYNFNPEYLNVEVTEESIMKNPEISISTLEKIKNLGININIDDFGTGYSSLAYLKKLPVCKLKIDRSFIKDLPNDKDDAIITSTIIAMAKSLNLGVVAEGVENKIQRDFVFEKGCDYVQGYYYSPPIEAKEFEEKFLKGQYGSK